MQIEDLKRWHWILIAVIVGLALSAVYSSTAAEGWAAERRTVGPQDFLWRLGQTARDASGTDRPVFRNIRIYPPVEGKQVVTFEEALTSRGSNGRLQISEYQPRQLVAEIPFVVNRRFPPKDPGYTIVDELTRRRDTAQKNLASARKIRGESTGDANRLKMLETAVAMAENRAEALDFSYAAWASKPWIYSIFTGSSVLLIGIIWPSVLAWLQGAGLGTPARQKQEKVDLSKVKPHKPLPSKVAVSGPTREQLEELSAVTAQYERNVGGMQISSAEPKPASASSSSSVGAVRKWEAGPIESQTASQPVEPEHDYAGEFYPVDRGVKKKTG